MFDTNYPLTLLASVSDGSKTIVEDPADSLEDNFMVRDLTISKTVVNLCIFAIPLYLSVHFLYDNYMQSSLFHPNYESTYILSMILRI